MTAARMPFGRYKGWLLQDLPENYISWLFSRDLHAWLREALLAECRVRSGPHGARPHEHKTRERSRPAAPIVGALDPDAAREVIDAGRRALARLYHPDVGGDADRMRAVNAAADALRSFVAGPGRPA